MTPVPVKTIEAALAASERKREREVIETIRASIREERPLDESAEALADLCRSLNLDAAVVRRWWQILSREAELAALTAPDKLAAAEEKLAEADAEHLEWSGSYGNPGRYEREEKKLRHQRGAAHDKRLYADRAFQKLMDGEAELEDLRSRYGALFDQDHTKESKQ